MEFANTLLQKLFASQDKTLTENGATALSSAKSGALLDLFALSGSLRSRVGEVDGKFASAFAEDKLLATKLAFYARDVRGGLGERETARHMFRTLANVAPDIMRKNLRLVAEYGRWDDLFCLLATPVEEDVVLLVHEQLEKDLADLKEGKPISLLAKWLPSANASSPKTRRTARKIAKGLGMSEREYRKALSSLRGYLNVTEVRMTAKDYESIRYEAVPSYAMKRYRKAFDRNDNERFNAYLESLAKGEASIHAGTLYPYDIIAKYTNDIFRMMGKFPEIPALDPVLEEQWKALPDYIEGENNFLVMVDVSGSMTGRPMATSVGLGIYFAERNKGAFAGTFMTFSAMPQIVKITGDSLLAKVACVAQADWGYNTNLEAAFGAVLETAAANAIPQEDMPVSIIVISDMEIDHLLQSTKWTFVEEMKQRFEAKGYQMPNLVLWNVESRHDVFHAAGPAKGVQMCSGQSASVFKTLLASMGMTPYEYMVHVLSDPRYDAITVE